MQEDDTDDNASLIEAMKKARDILNAVLEGV